MDSVSCSFIVTDPYCHSGEASQRAARPSLQEWNHSQPAHPAQGQLLPHFHTPYTQADSTEYGKVPEILLLSGYLTVLMEFTWTWASLLKLLHSYPPACSQAITNLVAETNWLAQYMRHNFYRGAAGRVFSCMSVLSKTYQRWGRSTVHSHSCPHHWAWVRCLLHEQPHFPPWASPGWHRAPDKSRHLGETSPGRNR